MKQRQLLVGIRTEQENFEEFQEACRRAQQQLGPMDPVHRLYFFDMGTLTKIFSPKRMELLRILRCVGPMNIRQLARKLKRNYSNVHQDITRLHTLGLVELSTGGRYHVPWDSIIMELSSQPDAA